MQIILLDDVKDIGHEGDLVDVADGYARNYLIPRGLAVQASKGAHTELAQRRRAIEQRGAEKRTDAQQVGEQLREKAIVIEASVGEGGRLHGQVTPLQIAAAVAEQFGLDIDRRDIDIPVPIRETGDYLVSAALYKDVTTELPIHVVATGAPQPAQTAEAVPQEVAAPAEETVSEDTTGDESTEEINA